MTNITSQIQSIKESAKIAYQQKNLEVLQILYQQITSFADLPNNNPNRESACQVALSILGQKQSLER